MDNTFQEYEYYSSSSEEDTEDFTKQTHFMNNMPITEYEKNRNQLFTKDIIRKHIVIDSHNYFQPDNFNTSNFRINFDFENSSGSTMVTTNYDIYTNVIGFRLLKTTIRTPPYNVNATNNIIKYKIGTSDTIHTITMHKGTYTMEELANVFQIYDGAYTLQDADNLTETYNINTLSQYVEYSDASVGTPSGTPTEDDDTGDITVTPDDTTFSAIFHDSISDTNSSTSGIKGLIFELTYNHGSNEITILWDHDNITRGAGRLFGFLPKTLTSVGRKLFSDRTPDVSSHFVDLVIPEIPSIACKRNSSGRDIVDRIQLGVGHGEYLHFHPVPDETIIQNYFPPKKLHRLTIQLYSVNNEFYDTNNSDISFEFEITMVRNKRLLH
tara:strand:- start:517 stop:1662 length:1146 start_codon:yes stop_codon:yes gene_type:complete